MSSDTGGRSAFSPWQRRLDPSLARAESLAPFAAFRAARARGGPARRLRADAALALRECRRAWRLALLLGPAALWLLAGWAPVEAFVAAALGALATAGWWGADRSGLLSAAQERPRRADGLVELLLAPRGRRAELEDLWLAGADGRELAESTAAEYRERLGPWLWALVLAPGLAAPFHAWGALADSGAVAVLALPAAALLVLALRRYAETAALLGASNLLLALVRRWTARTKSGVLDEIAAPFEEHPLEVLLVGVLPVMVLLGGGGVAVGAWAAGGAMTVFEVAAGVEVAGRFALERAAGAALGLAAPAAALWCMAWCLEHGADRRREWLLSFADEGFRAYFAHDVAGEEIAPLTRRQLLGAGALRPARA
ncbi:MAG: hypothetical protein SF028_05010 [Candidatus Sumerlaeia bacterium]|nr:hypothetical protein [Candidatus Sumerlaeia bacterium]